MKSTRIVRSTLALLMLAGAVGFVAGAGQVAASSHREAPYIATDPEADNTDLYAFVSPDAPNTVTIIAMARKTSPTGLTFRPRPSALTLSCTTPGPSHPSPIPTGACARYTT